MSRSIYDLKDGALRQMMFCGMCQFIHKFLSYSPQFTLVNAIIYRNKRRFVVALLMNIVYRDIAVAKLH
jgi:hypothetical protein